jgi:hypothetical protein
MDPYARLFECDAGLFEAAGVPFEADAGLFETGAGRFGSDAGLFESGAGLFEADAGLFRIVFAFGGSALAMRTGSLTTL